MYVVTKGQAGHRNEYNIAISAVLKSLGFSPVVFDPDVELRRLNGPCIFTMIEEDVGAFVRAAISSPFSGCSVMGLLFRPAECFEWRTRSVAKRLLLSVLKRIPTVQITTILPFNMDARFGAIANSWTFDPHMWDWAVTPSTVPRQASLTREIAALAGRRKVVLAPGYQNRRKGFEYFCDLWTNSDRLREEYLFVAAGAVDDEVRHCIQPFLNANGVLIDRFMSAEELDELHALSATIWGCYEPSYNQASGVCGKAFQLGIPVIVRQSSYIESILECLHHPIVALNFGESGQASATLLKHLPALQRKVPDKCIVEPMVRRFSDCLVAVFGRQLPVS